MLDKMRFDKRVGFMQGRLSDMTDGRIQSFPWTHWQEEFQIACEHGFRILEWTLDQDRLREQPLMTSVGQARIREISFRHSLAVVSVTGDCFMQAPFWKAHGERREELQSDFRMVADACATMGVRTIVIPLVDNGRLENAAQEEVLVTFMQNQAAFLARVNLRVAFESDFGPMELVRFITRFDPAHFGISYDIGNSAALGFNPTQEVAAYGCRIVNVHVKDRLLGGSTVPLGDGSVDFAAVFRALGEIEYTGNYVLQTAPAANGDHAGVLCRYRDMVFSYLTRYGC